MAKFCIDLETIFFALGNLFGCTIQVAASQIFVTRLCEWHEKTRGELSADFLGDSTAPKTMD